jgi:hypothetical protein
MKVFWFLAFALAFFFVIWPIVAASMTYYGAAVATGSGDCSSPTSRCQIGTWLANATKSAAGNMLMLANGRYIGSNSMIKPPSGRTGSAGNPITIRAESEGQVDIDGQGARIPVDLELGNDYFTVIGVNGHSSSGEALRINRANHATIQRSIFWDAKDLNYNICGINYGASNLLEDDACFGVGRKAFLAYGTPGPNTMRRLWTRFEYSTVYSPHIGLSGSYNSFNSLFENVLATWDQSHIPTYLVRDCRGKPLVNCPKCSRLGGTTFGDGTCQISNHNLDDGSTPLAPISADSNSGVGISDAANLRILGSIAYVKPGGYLQRNQLVYIANLDAVTLKDLVAIFPAGDSAFACAAPSCRTIITSNGIDSRTGSHATNITSSKGLSNGYAPFAADWIKANIVEAVSPSTLYTDPGESVYNTTKGAQIRYRYVDGVLTATELWPWPMSQRIKDATTQASTDGHNHPIEDIDNTIQNVLGVGAFP